MIELMGRLIGFIFLGLIVYCILKHKGTHPDIFTLEENENIVEIVKGDYWIKEFLWQESQNSGELAFTNKALLFKGTFLNSSDKNIRIPYSEIIEIKKTNICSIFPMAFTIQTANNEKYKFAVMKRNYYIELIQNLAKKNESK